VLAAVREQREPRYASLRIWDAARSLCATQSTLITSALVQYAAATGSPNLLRGGLVIFLICGTGAAAAFVLRGIGSRAAMLAGCLLLLAGVAVTFSAIADDDVRWVPRRHHGRGRRLRSRLLERLPEAFRR
jgi:hypothetical protein